MNGLLYLSSDDFFIQDTPSGKLLNTYSTQGLILILFYSTQCKHCVNAIPIFRNLPQMIHGCSFGMINVSTNARVVHMSKSTVSPIQYVPYIVLYFNGEPYYKYKGQVNIENIQRFISEVSKMLVGKQKFGNESSKKIPSQQSSKEEDKKIPEYTIAIPYCDEDVCYLEFDTAYTKLQ